MSPLMLGIICWLRDRELLLIPRGPSPSCLPVNSHQQDQERSSSCLPLEEQLEQTDTTLAFSDAIVTCEDVDDDEILGEADPSEEEDGKIDYLSPPSVASSLVCVQRRNSLVHQKFQSM